MPALLLLAPGARGSPHLHDLNVLFFFSWCPTTCLGSAERSLSPAPWAAALQAGTSHPLPSQRVRGTSRAELFSISSAISEAASWRLRERGFASPAAASRVCLPQARLGPGAPAAEGCEPLPACGHFPKRRHVIKLLIKVFCIGCAALSPEPLPLRRALRFGQEWERGGGSEESGRHGAGVGRAPAAPPLTAGVEGPAAGHGQGAVRTSAWWCPVPSGTASSRVRTEDPSPSSPAAMEQGSKLFKQERELKLSLAQGMKTGRKDPKTSRKEEMEMTKTQL